MTDDVAGKALVEQFALETFTRADNAVRANKASRQTADTFQASATFMELLAIWGPIEQELQQKIKFAKFHALRIAKALKAGEDPNLSNPKPEPSPDEAVSPLDPNDPEVRALTGDTASRQPSVVDVPDEAHNLQAKLAHQSIANESIHPSRAPSVPPPNERSTSQAASAGVSPLPTTDAANFYGNPQDRGSPVSPDRQSVGGNYFPRMPSPSSAQPQSDGPPALPSAPDGSGDSSPTINLPSAPANPAGTQPEPTLPDPPTVFTPSQQMPPRTPLDSFQAPPAVGPSTFDTLPPTLPHNPPPTRQNFQPPPPQPSVVPYSPPILTPGPLPSAVAPPPIQRAQPAAPTQPTFAPRNDPVPVPVSNVVVDEEAMMKAQKHARWAISALNFEDVPTAIKEFQLALQTLGAR